MGNGWSLYKHTNIENCKVYIGITGTSVEKRWNNGLGYKRCPLFYRAINKYGWDNFKHEVIIDNLSKEEAIMLEIKYIVKYNSNNNNFGYNISSGGGGSNGIKLSDETKEKMRLNNIGENNPMFGRKQSEEARKKMSARKKGIPLKESQKEKMSESRKGSKNANSKMVICLETNKIYNYIQEAADDLHVHGTKISACCRGKRNTTGGYHFKYYETS